MATNAEWIEAMKAKGHSPVLDEDGELDSFVLAAGYHNGPGCSVCGWSTCEHCNEPATARIPQCTAIDVAPLASPTALQDGEG